MWYPSSIPTLEVKAGWAVPGQPGILSLNKGTVTAGGWHFRSSLSALIYKENADRWGLSASLSSKTKDKMMDKLHRIPEGKVGQVCVKSHVTLRVGEMQTHNKSAMKKNWRSGDRQPLVEHPRGRGLSPGFSLYSANASGRQWVTARTLCSLSAFSSCFMVC